MARRTYELAPDMSAALDKEPVDYIEDWWKANSSEEEQKAAEDRGATASGALAFVESVVRKHGKGGGGTHRLPDDLTYRLAAIFLRNGVGGYFTSVRTGQCDLVFVRKFGKPYIDLEIREGKIRQMMYSHNMEVKPRSADGRLCALIAKAFRRPAKRVA